MTNTPETDASCSRSFCECVNWCRDGRDMFSPHHPRCQHYTPLPTDPRFARFGEAVWKFIEKIGGNFCDEEISEDILPLAQAAGLCCRVDYHPEIHGENINAEPGDEIWWWGDSPPNPQPPTDPPEADNADPAGLMTRLVRQRCPGGWQAAKIGTQPATIILDGRCTFEVGSVVRFKRPPIGERNIRYIRWQRGEITNLHPLRISL